MRQYLGIIALLITTSILNAQDSTIDTTRTSLKGSTWNSQYYHYAHFYQFDSDSSGHCESAQVNWSLPIKLDSAQLNPDAFEYEPPIEFRYYIRDSILLIQYSNLNGEEAYIDKYYFRKKYKDWIAHHEYTYGREVLKPGNKILELKP